MNANPSIEVMNSSEKTCTKHCYVSQKIQRFSCATVHNTALVPAATIGLLQWYWYCGERRQILREKCKGCKNGSIRQF